MFSRGKGPSDICLLKNSVSLLLSYFHTVFPVYKVLEVFKPATSQNVHMHCTCDAVKEVTLHDCYNNIVLLLCVWICVTVHSNVLLPLPFLLHHSTKILHHLPLTNRFSACTFIPLSLPQTSPIPSHPPPPSLILKCSVPGIHTQNHFQ
jgi:hypothetical protein